MKTFSLIAIFLFVYVLSSPSFAQTGRPSLITESLFAPTKDQYLYDKRSPSYSNEDHLPAMTWHKILLGMNISNPPPSSKRYSQIYCHYDTALSVLGDIRNTKNDPYQKIWSENQNLVFSACDDRNRANTPPVEPLGEDLPKRAKSDFEYQLASWHFYQGNYDKALKIYMTLEEDLNAPMRPLANYMIVRTLSYIGQKEDAYNKIIDVLADKSLASVHDLATNYRFIIMYNTSSGNGFENIAEKHMRWLLEKIQARPEQANNLEQAFANYFDARQQLDKYFPLYAPKTKSIDWWLQENTPASPRMKAVHALARENETADWLQSSWAYNIFDTDWLWALHLQDMPYWEQNKNIVNHAWKRWEAGDGLEWLEIAIERIHPNNSLSTEVVKAAQVYIDRDWQQRQETLEYRIWLHNVWLHSIRIQLAHKNYDAAKKLVFNNPDFENLINDKSYRSSHKYAHQRDLAKILRWLVYTGETETAREFLSILVDLYPQSFKHWRTLLATSWQESMVSAQPQNSWRKGVDNAPVLWKKMVNVLPTDKLYEIASQARLENDLRPPLSLSILTRGMLLKDDKNINEYALLAADQYPASRQAILNAVSRNRASDYVDFMLYTPRMRPVPYTQGSIYTPWGKFNKDLAAIDVYNHNDNNWWCVFDLELLIAQIFKAASVTPHSPRRLFREYNEQFQQEVQSYSTKQREALAHHPYRGGPRNSDSVLSYFL